jgi:hypothetical protein
MSRGTWHTKRVIAPLAAMAAVAMALPQVLTGSASAARKDPLTVDVSAFATQPVVLTGQDFPDWSSGPEATARAPQPPADYGVADSQAPLPSNLRSDCYQSNPQPDANGSTDQNHNDHNCFQGSQSPVRTALKGADPNSLRGYEWNGRSFVQIPFQVDTKWVHYLTNNASGFAFYSGADQMTTYTFNYQPFVETSNPALPHDCPGVDTGCIPPGPDQIKEAAIVCHAQAPNGTPDPTPDPNKSLINTDELAFMARDAAGAAPNKTVLPKGIVSAYKVRLVDPSTHEIRFVYVMESAPGDKSGTYAVPMRYTAANSPYVHYTPDQDAGMMAHSESDYNSYGNAPVGPACASNGTPEGTPVIGHGFKYDSAGDIVLDPGTYVRRRTLDTGWITTPRYRFRYDGRMIMDNLGVSRDDKGLRTGDYGPTMVDRWKGRAFQQAPGGKTPCCGYEDEQVNWNGSSMTMGMKAGPVRVIRVTWGSDSGTNVTRTDIFSAYSVVHQFGLRVHPIPPLDGIYTQWDMAAGRVTTYYNPYNPKGVPITGINPVLLGDTNAHIGPDGISESSNDKLGRSVGPISAGNPSNQTCTSDACVYNSFNVGDPTFSGEAPELLSWEEMTGPAGTLIEKWQNDQSSVSPGGAQGLVEAQPYYVDDACFDDGTGNDPGPRVIPRSADEPTTWGFEDSGGSPVAVSPAPAPASRYPGLVTKDGQTYDGTQAFQRRCWNHRLDGSPYNMPGTATYDSSKPAEASDPPPDPTFGPQGDVRYFQGDVATHGLHLLFTSDSDNADATVPLDEEDSIDTQMILPPDLGNVGQAATLPLTAPIQAVATPVGLKSVSAPTPYVAGSGVPNSPVTGTDSTGSSNPNAPDSLVPQAPPAQTPTAARRATARRAH